MSDKYIYAKNFIALNSQEVFNTFFPQVTPPVLVCSLAGAALYVLSKKNYIFWKQSLFAIISFLGGVYSAGISSEILTGIINSVLKKLDAGTSITVPPALGALFASAICVSILLKVMSHVKNKPSYFQENDWK